MQGQDPKQGNAALSYKESENYAKLLQIYGPGLEAQIEKTVSEHYNLIPKATAVNLLAAINGVLSRQKISISQLNRAQRNFDVEGIVRRIYPIYNPPGGSGAKSVRIVMGDSDGKNEATCVLWGQQSDRVQGEIGIGDKIEVQGAYYRRGEVHAGENSVIRIVEKVPCTNVKNLSYGLLNIEG
ncbi:hypothetical protein FJZ26_04800, partial [Candidatus Parvarchaeota archaeon]|nr:hypothetical protein [Candidatus Parvarchaeota archaeon]